MDDKRSKMTRDEFIFGKVWPGRCWHRIVGSQPYILDGVDVGSLFVCSCGKELHGAVVAWHLNLSNPDFSTWPGFGMLLEGMRKRPDWKRFGLYLVYGKDYCKQLEPPDFYEAIPIEYINPNSLADAVASFFGWEVDHGNGTD